MLAWRDMKHPQRGGAEVVTDIYLAGLAKKGHEVTLFSSRFPDSPEEEEYNGYKIIRKGGKLGVYLAGLMYAQKHQKELDIIIDQVNTIPFMTPLAINKNKRVAYFNQLCKDVWFYETPFPIALVGNVIESIYLKFYKNTRILTISESTKKDMIRDAWVKPENIFISQMQIDFKPIKYVEKKENQFVFCARIVPSKRPSDCIKALSLIENKETKLYIIGDGDAKYKKQLEKLIDSLNLKERVIFTGRVSREKRNSIMTKSLAILVTSVREGWGLIVTESNANGTLAITYNVPGLIDANKTGFITEKNENNPKALAKYMNNLTPDKPESKVILNRQGKNSLSFAKDHSNWNYQVEALEKWLKHQ
jgi:glycosyltransferase involved in cell wall biosynthesis